VEEEDEEDDDVEEVEAIGNGSGDWRIQ